MPHVNNIESDQSVRCTKIEIHDFLNVIIVNKHVQCMYIFRAFIVS